MAQDRVRVSMLMASVVTTNMPKAASASRVVLAWSPWITLRPVRSAQMERSAATGTAPAVVVALMLHRCVTLVRLAPEESVWVPRDGACTYFQLHDYIFSLTVVSYLVTFLHIRTDMMHL
jgi:hypothetical protein